MSHFLASWKGAERKQMDQCRLQYVKVMTSQPSRLTTNVEEGEEKGGADATAQRRGRVEGCYPCVRVDANRQRGQVMVSRGPRAEGRVKGTRFCQNALRRQRALTSSLSRVPAGMADLLEATVLHLSSSPSDCFFPLAEFKGGDSTVTPQSLTPMEQLGVQLTIRYGDHLGLLEGGSERDLCLLVTHCRHSSSDQQAHTTSTLCILIGCL
ncbi:hypothetical protein Z043_114506 [Scleropages formosus]|uniref:BROMI C-terminal Rab TBC-like domain-containing protein n=1 Tax=Scleropages formosus TaxID=113540 RepID=A0A0P7WYJ3_SCLFO|nr:hypothetical protein Z043_114506 [Scleropages formosus]